MSKFRSLTPEEESTIEGLVTELDINTVIPKDTESDSGLEFMREVNGVVFIILFEYSRTDGKLKVKVNEVLMIEKETHYYIVENPQYNQRIIELFESKK